MTEPTKVFTLAEVQEMIEKASVVEMSIDKLLFDSKRYSRKGVDDGAIEDYSHNLFTMPAIIVSPANLGLIPPTKPIKKDKWETIEEEKLYKESERKYSEDLKLYESEDKKYAIVNGVHRYKALLKANQNAARIKIIQIPRNDVDYVGLILDLGYGVRHPESDIKKMCVNKFTAIPEVDDLYRSVMGVELKTYYKWTSDVRREKQEIIHEGMIIKYLDATRTQESVATEYGYSKMRLSQIVDEVSKIFLNVRKTLPPYKITVVEEGEQKEKQFETLDEYLEHKEMSFLKPALTFSPQIYNIWNQKGMDHDTTHFGAFPTSYMQNLLYYHTNPFDVVYDPFAGGGTTIDACKTMIRRYYVSDRKPIGDKADVIRKWDIGDGIPKDLPKPDLVFLDPPYWAQAKGKYSTDEKDLANMTLDDFYKSIESLIDNLKDKKYEKIAIVIQPTQWGTNDNHDWEDHVFKFDKMFSDKYRISARYNLPYSTEQYNAQMVIESKEKKLCLSSYRDLMVWERMK